MNKSNERNLGCIPSFLCFCFFVHVISAVSNNPTSRYPEPPEVILLNCGELVQTEASDGRSWIGDVRSRFQPSSQNTVISTANSQISVPQIPYMTARIFHSEGNYIFPVSAGRKFIRLYFYPANYGSLDASNAFFSVSSGPYTLLHNFSTFITAKAMNFDFLIQEFSINTVDGFLNLTFTPSPDRLNAYAFVNGIEIVSVPNIFSQPARVILDEGLPPQTFQISNETALQTVVRLNVGGRDISPVEDSGLFRAWSDDSAYIYGAAFGVSFPSNLNKTIGYTASVPPYTAPLEVYKTARSMGPDPYINRNYNLTWIFPVDAGFNYLVRLHFCEIQSIIYRVNQRVFKIFLHNQTAEAEADVVAWGGANGVPVYKDYYVMIGQDPSRELWVALYPNVGTGTEYFDSILNGIEIFKVSNSDGNLGGPNPILPPDLPSYPALVKRQLQLRNSRNRNLVGVVAGAIVIVALSFLAFAVLRRWAPKSFCRLQQLKNELRPPFVIFSKHGHHHSFAEMKMSADDYDGAYLQADKLTINGRPSISSEDSDGPTRGAEFSQIMEGR